MKLDKIKLTNFRCFEDLSIKLHPRLTVLVAENGGGKTTLLDAIAKGLSPMLRFLSGPEQRLPSVGLQDNDYRMSTRSNCKAGAKAVMADYVQIEVHSSNGLTWDVSRTKSGKQTPTKIGQTALKNSCVAKLHKLDAGEPAMLPVVAYYGTLRGNIGIPDRMRGTPKANYDYPTAALYDSLLANSDFKEAVKWFYMEESTELRINKGRELQDYQLSPGLEAVRAAISQILGDRYSNPHFNNKNKFVVETNDPSLPEIQVAQLSMGYQSMLALAIDYARRLATANPFLAQSDAPAFEYNEAINAFGGFDPDAVDHLGGVGLAPSIMLIDEVDLHLHPEWQQRVLDDLMRTFPNTQFIVTTHSPQVVSTVPQEHIRILKDGIIHQAPAGTEGAEVNRILRDVFNVNPRPDTKHAKFLQRYLDLIDSKDWDSDEAKELRQLLDEWSKGQEPLLNDADLRIENLKWEAEL